MSMRIENPLTPRRLAVLVALIAALAMPAAARADAQAVIKDCADDGQLNGTYTNSELKKARAQLPSDLDEYTDCRDAITARIAENSRTKTSKSGTTSPPIATGGSSSGGGLGGPPPSGSATPAEVQQQQAQDQAQFDQLKKNVQSGGPPSISVGGQQISPAAGPFAPASAVNELPISVLLALLGVALLGAVAGLISIRRRLSPAVLDRLPSFPRGSGAAKAWSGRLTGLRRATLRTFRS
jgi:hypothetical protein